MKTVIPVHKRSSRAAANGSTATVRRVNHGKLSRLAGRWPVKEADRIATFISENCETVHEEN